MPTSTMKTSQEPLFKIERQRERFGGVTCNSLEIIIVCVWGAYYYSLVLLEAMFGVYIIIICAIISCIWGGDYYNLGF